MGVLNSNSKLADILAELLEQSKKYKENQEEFNKFLEQFKKDNSENKALNRYLNSSHIKTQLTESGLEFISQANNNHRFTYAGPTADGRGHDFLIGGPESYEFFAKKMYEMDPSQTMNIGETLGKNGLQLARELMKVGFSGDQIKFQDEKQQEIFDKMNQKPSENNLPSQSKAQSTNPSPLFFYEGKPLSKEQEQEQKREQELLPDPFESSSPSLV
ncbi:hypothetical protein L3V82_03445 [Thiotrichales bacterium 19S3-7]|nr:hypothetical protein [Thiotrichales bacterium 19S3-7]MCF6801299.1 hypothetical protein [Thiotrichales bacterium 19S3-11]